MNISNRLIERIINVLSNYRYLLNVMSAGQGMRYNPNETVSVSNSTSELIGELKNLLLQEKQKG